jgi:hypothetical protein
MVDGFEDNAPESLIPTWWLLDREPGMDDLATQAGDSLEKMGEDLKIYPFQETDGGDRLFLARFEMPKYGEGFEFSEAVVGESKGFIDFLAGFTIDCVEMLVAIGERSSIADQVSAKDGTGNVAAPVPTGEFGFFKWPDMTKVLLNLTAIPEKDVKIMAPNLKGELEPAKVHWWFRVQIAGDEKFPVPGEFLGLGVRMMPDVYWGHQKSSPFLYSGNWMDTVYYSGGRITEVIDPTEETPYPTYKVQWRKDELTVNPSDFAEYKVDDRVTILKDVATEKTTQLWKDDDMKADCDKTVWQIAPITFYGLETEGE